MPIETDQQYLERVIEELRCENARLREHRRVAKDVTLTGDEVVILGDLWESLTFHKLAHPAMTVLERVIAQ